MRKASLIIIAIVAALIVTILPAGASELLTSPVSPVSPLPLPRIPETCVSEIDQEYHEPEQGYHWRQWRLEYGGAQKPCTLPEQYTYRFCFDVPLWGQDGDRLYICSWFDRDLMDGELYSVCNRDCGNWSEGCDYVCWNALYPPDMIDPTPTPYPPTVWKLDDAWYKNATTACAMWTDGKRIVRLECP